MLPNPSIINSILAIPYIQAERVYFQVQLPTTTTTTATQLPGKSKFSPEEGVPMFFSREWSVGKVVDYIAQRHKLKNENNNPLAKVGRGGKEGGSGEREGGMEGGVGEGGRESGGEGGWEQEEGGRVEREGEWRGRESGEGGRVEGKESGEGGRVEGRESGGEGGWEQEEGGRVEREGGNRRREGWSEGVSQRKGRRMTGGEMGE